ncbi:MAG TPA: sigma-70 family RNA polymerase sigma factor, partial [Alphaproteobacteria bacterium]|nr:sigma-70 family RNA polymerase sigma factor [Alphaproteobacteria bacterium]
MANSNFSPELKKVLRQKTPSGKEIFELVKRYKKYRNGKRKEELREEILTINTKLVAYLAQKFAPTASVPVDDLFQAGMEGLIHALEKFSYRKGFRFSTYASFWIKRSMQMIREDDCAVSVSRYNRQTVSNLLKEGKGHIDFTDMTKEKSRALTILNAMNDKAYVYLDKPIETDTQAAAFKFEIKDPKDYEEGIFSTFANEDLEKALSKTLTDREKVVITKRYLEPIPMPYAEIVKEEVFGVKSADIARMSELR